MNLEGATSFEKGIDFITFFSGRSFTVYDIMGRYSVSYRQAQRIKGQVDRVLGIKPAGLGPRNSFLWKIGRE